MALRLGKKNAAAAIKAKWKTPGKLRSHKRLNCKPPLTHSSNRPTSTSKLSTPTHPVFGPNYFRIPSPEIDEYG